MTTNTKLTNMEATVVHWLHNNLIVDECDYSLIEAAHVAQGTGIDIKILRGVLSSLIKKDIIYICLDDHNNHHEELIYLFDSEVS